MTTKLFLSGFLLVVLMTSCGESSEYFTESKPLHLVNIWMQTCEGNCWTGKNLFFKSGDDMDMTSWRYKNRLDVRADGTITYLVANKMDKYYKGEPILVTGTWTYDSDTETLLILDSVGQNIYSFHVQAAYGDTLIISYNEIETNSPPK